jgi:hypothetical protein
MAPGDAGVQDEEDAAERRAVGEALAPWVAEAARMRRQQRFD